MLETWFHMGGYARYVWPACVLVVLLFLIFGLKATFQLRRLLGKKMVDQYVNEAQTTDISNY